jgi:endonuclease YncB( thermonuclease family)
VFNGININLAMVEDGQAFAYRKYLGDCNAREYLDAEYRASRRRYGVWQV